MPEGVRSMDGLAAGLGELANEFEAIFFTPFAKRVVRGRLFIRMPGTELTCIFEQRFEVRIGTSFAKEAVDRFSGAREMLLCEAKSERTAEIELVLVRNRDVQALVFNVLRRLLVDPFPAPMNQAACPADVRLAFDGSNLAGADPLIGSAQFIEVYGDSHAGPLPGG